MADNGRRPLRSLPFHVLALTSFLVFCVFSAPKILADGSSILAPTAEELGLTSDVEVDPYRVIVMHSRAGCVGEQSAKDYSSALRGSFGSDEIRAVETFISAQQNSATLESVVTPQELPRRKNTLDALAVLMAIRQAGSDGKRVAEGIITKAQSHEASGAKRRLTDADMGWKSPSDKFMPELLVDVVSDPEGILGSKQLSDLANKLPCLQTRVVPELFFPRSEFFGAESQTSSTFRAASTTDTQSGRVIPNDSLFNNLWHLSNTKVVDAWTRFSGSEHAMTVAVVDSGCSFHPDLAANLWIDSDNPKCAGASPDNPSKESGCYGYDFGDGNGNPLNEPVESLHGTGVAGVIAARPNNYYGIAGICWNCKIACLKVVRDERVIPLSALLSAYNFILEKKIKISNHSYAGYGNVAAQYEAIDVLRSAGHLFVTCSGNDACDIDQFPSNCRGPSPLRPGGYALDNVLTVGASNSEDLKPSFSNWGRTSVDLFAPGSQIAMLRNTRDKSTNPQGFAISSGTSFSSPIVAGIAALVWSANPTFTYAEVKSKLLTAARQVSGLQGYAVVPGVVDASAALADSSLTDSPRQSEPSPKKDYTDVFYSFGMAPRPSLVLHLFTCVVAVVNIAKL